MDTASRWIMPLAALIGLLAPALTADVLTVGPSGDFTNIQSAVNAAGDGDIVLVSTGTYPTFTIVDRSVTVVADTGAVVGVSGGGIIVRDLAEQRAVVLSGLGVTTTGSDALQLLDNLGSVRVEGCEFGSLTGFSGAVVSASQDVAFTECVIGAGDNVFLQLQPGRPGAAVADSTVVFFACDVTGGRGSVGSTPAGGPCHPGQTGGPGLFVESAAVYASASVFEGGPGGPGAGGSEVVCMPTDGGAGGPGVELAGPGAVFRGLAVTLTGGAGGAGHPGCPLWCGFPSDDGVSGLPIENHGGLQIDVPRAPHGMSMPVPVREFEPITVDFGGLDGDAVGVFASVAPNNVFEPVLQSPVLVSFDVAFEFLLVGVVPVTQVLTVSGSFAALPGIEGATVYFQPIFLGTDGVLTMGSPVTQVVLDSFF